MPRKRAIPDQKILAAAAGVMARMGPADFTLAALGQEIGLAPATLLQRFGSKRGLMLAFVARAAAETDQLFADALRKAASPLAALVDMLASCASFIGKPEELANHLAFLQMDLVDPEFYRHTLAQTRAFLAGVERFLTAAQKKKEIRTDNVKRLARLLVVTYNGSLLLWCVLRRGSVNRFVRDQVQAVLEPFSGRPARPCRRPGSSRKDET